MPALPQPRMSLEAFLAWEQAQEPRHEFVDGEVYAMAGGSVHHAHIGVNLAVLLRSQLRARGCFTFHEGMKVRAGDNILYPDLVVSCDPRQLERDLVEVFVREPGGWHYSLRAGPEAVVELAAPACRLPLAEIYEGLVGRLGGGDCPGS